MSGQAVCPEDVPDQYVLRTGASLELPADTGCTERRILRSYHTPLVRGVWFPIVHRSCVHNEAFGLVRRVLCPVPEPSAQGMGAFARAMQRIGNQMLKGGLIEPWDIPRILACYSGAKRVRYENAHVQLLRGLNDERSARVAAHIKVEKLNSSKVAKAPRIIQARSPSYNLELFQWYKPFESRLYRLKGFRDFGVPPTRVVAKGLSGSERAALMIEKIGNIGTDFVVVSIDCSTFDAHVSVSQLELEHRLVRRVCGSDPRLAWLLRQQLTTRGITAHGIRYTAVGGRCSGDPNTGAGNTIIQLAMSVASAIDAGLEVFDLLADGDNALVFARGSDLERIQATFPGSFLSMGHEVVVEGVARVVEEVELGQCRPVLTSLGWSMVRNPCRQLSHAFVDIQQRSTSRKAREWMKTVAACELWLSRGVPVFQAWYEAVVVALEDSNYLETFRRDGHLNDVRGDWRAARTMPVTPEARASFFRAWGWDADVQVELERQLVAQARRDVLAFSIPEWTITTLPARPLDLAPD